MIILSFMMHEGLLDVVKLSESTEKLELEARVFCTFLNLVKQMKQISVFESSCP